MLHSGHVIDTGHTTVDGTPAIGPKFTIAPIDGAAQPPVFLFVDAHTCQPLQTVTRIDHDSVYMSDWMPTTTTNIALARDDSIPAGYAQVATPC